ncbi:MAG: hypothetical protein D6681_13720 [Calditrichaeota bacterium]|nr:MAG: hypothetical protein D6681_13720 [Calditrichota bacterium]
MKLRYFHLRGAPPIFDLAIPFPREPILRRDLSVRFVVGVNGSGKTRLLQAFTEILLALGGKSRRLPYPFTLAYDIGTPNPRTVFIHNPEGEAPEAEPVWIEFEACLPEETDWAALEQMDWKDGTPPAPVHNRYLSDVPLSVPVDEYLPAPILVYTSGQTDTWERLFTVSLFESDLDPAQQPLVEEMMEERPSGWTHSKERDYQEQIGGAGPSDAAGLESGYRTAQSAIFMDGFRLKLAAAAVTLHLAYRDRDMPDGESSDPTLRALLDEIGWDAPVVLSLQLTQAPQDLRETGMRDQLRKLYEAASSVLRPPEPGEGRRLVFDLGKSISDTAGDDVSSQGARTTLEALLETLGGEHPTPFTVFRAFHAWWELGLLTDVDLVFRHRLVPDLMRANWLSDGERMFLGRIALFYLLQDMDDALLILDEPETHFNDVWKRQLVDILDRALKDQKIEVVISTHSSIALTEAFAQEIALLKNGTLGRVTTPTFGSDPSEIMINVFDAPDSIGERALEYLDTLLDKTDWTPAEIEELGQLIQHIGPGYYRSELRIKWRQLRASQG